MTIPIEIENMESIDSETYTENLNIPSAVYDGKCLYKLLQKLWMLHDKIKKKITNNKSESEENDNIEKFTNQMIYKIIAKNKWNN